VSPYRGRHTVVEVWALPASRHCRHHGLQLRRLRKEYFAPSQLQLLQMPKKLRSRGPERHRCCEGLLLPMSSHRRTYSSHLIGTRPVVVFVCILVFLRYFARMDRLYHSHVFAFASHISPVTLHICNRNTAMILCPDHDLARPR